MQKANTKSLKYVTYFLNPGPPFMTFIKMIIYLL